MRSRLSCPVSCTYLTMSSFRVFALQAVIRKGELASENVSQHEPDLTVT